MLGWLKKSAVLIVLSLLVYGWFFATHQKVPTTLQVLGANTNINLFVQPDSGHVPIIESIDSAKREILVEVYLLSDQQVITALGDAKSRGLAVEVMLEEHPFGGGNINTKSKPELESANIPVQWTNPAYTLTHEKAIIIDGTAVWVMSQNLTAAAFDKNREYDILDTDPSDVAEARNVFVADWQRQNLNPPTNTNLLVSPVTARPALVTLIQNATKSLDLELEDIDDPQITSLLADKAKTLTVRIIAPTLKQIAGNTKALNSLKNAGVAVKTISTPYMHAKLILVDGKRAYVGSVNLSRQSLDENRELGIILTESASLETMQNTFTSDWDRGNVL